VQFTYQLMGAEISDPHVFEIMKMNMPMLMPKGSSEFVEGFEDMVRNQTGLLLSNPILFFCQFEETFSGGKPWPWCQKSPDAFSIGQAVDGGTPGGRPGPAGEFFAGLVSFKDQGMPGLQIPQGAGGEDMASAMLDAMESFQGMGDAFDMTALKVTSQAAATPPLRLSIVSDVCRVAPH
jgi:hypothetical protein